MAAYLTLDEFKALAPLPAEYIDAVEVCSAGYTELQLSYESAYIDSLLSKRYAVPFDPTKPYPLILKRWLSALVSLQIWLRRGLDATQQDAEIYIEAAKQARLDLTAAANAQDGLFELPLRGDLPGIGTVRPKPTSYSETSPFLSQRIQATRGREEDANGHGTRR